MTNSLLPVSFAHLRLDLRHPGNPAIVIFGLLAHVAQDLRMRQNDKCFLLDSRQGILRHLFRRQIAVSGLRPFRDQPQHLAIYPLPPLPVPVLGQNGPMRANCRSVSRMTWRMSFPRPTSHLNALPPIGAATASAPARSRSATTTLAAPAR